MVFPTAAWFLGTAALLEEARTCQTAVLAAYLRQPLAVSIMANPEGAFALAEEIDRHLAESA